MNENDRVFCKECYYFLRFVVGNTAIGECRFGAPQLLQGQLPLEGRPPSKMGVFPIMVAATGWCGDGVAG
jgi:hypothetical protein